MASKNDTAANAASSTDDGVGAKSSSSNGSPTNGHTQTPNGLSVAVAAAWQKDLF